MWRDNFPRLNIQEDTPDMPGSPLNKSVLNTRTPVSSIAFVGEDGFQHTISAKWFESPAFDLLRAEAVKKFGRASVGYTDYCRLAFSMDMNPEDVQESETPPDTVFLEESVKSCMPLIESIIAVLELEVTAQNLYAVYMFLRSRANFDEVCPDKKFFEELARSKQTIRSMESWF